MASFKCLFSLAILLLGTSLFFRSCFADEALIDSICKESQDYNFCSSSFNGDVRVLTADLHGLASITISHTISQVQDTLGRIPNLITQSKDPLGKQRLGVCQTDYNTSLGKFKSAFDSMTKNAYWDTFYFVRDGTNAVIDCHNIYRRDGPIATSPTAGDDTNVIKLSEIILIINSRLMNQK